MSASIILVDPLLAQTPAKKPHPTDSSFDIWMGVSGGLALLLVALGIYSKLQIDKLNKKVRFEDFRIKELDKKLKLALETIRKMETNPDLVYSREFNLDYLRMRMAEEVFHFAIVNQIKVKVKEKIAVALRPSQAQQTAVGIASASGRQVDEMFDVEYVPVEGVKAKKAVLFRIQIRLMKLPTQATSATINQIIDCIETFLSPGEEQDNWQPTIQGRIVHMEWDQKAKPTPLLVLEQSNDGVNVSFATRRDVPKAAGGAAAAPPPPPPMRRPPTPGAAKAPGNGAAKPGGQPGTKPANKAKK
ncbi:MAG: hypothetical protein U7127_21820 [Phormidium sp.]